MNPILSVPTRWFSNYYLLFRIFQISSEYNGLIEAEIEQIPLEHQDEFKKEYILTDKELEMIAFLIKILEIFLTKSKLLSSETLPSMSMIIPSYNQICAQLEYEKSKIQRESDDMLIYGHIIETTSGNFNNYQELEESHLDLSNIIKYSDNNKYYNLNDEKIAFLDQLIESLNEKFDNCDKSLLKNETVVISTITNPCYRFDYFDEQESEEWMQKMKKIMEDEEKEMKQQVNVSIVRNSYSISNNISLSLSQMSYNNDENENEVIDGRKRKQQEIKELEKYIEEYHPNEMTLQQIIDYWESKKNEYKILYRISKKYLCYIGSSAASERLFSHASGFYTDRRSRLLATHLEDLCVCQSWINSEGTSAFEGISFKN